jgi:aminopeptidase N
MLCTAIRNGGSVEFNYAYEQYKKESDSSIRADIGYGVSCSLEETQLTNYLNDHMKNESWDLFTAIRNVATNPMGSELAWNFVKSNWPVIYQR